MSEATTFKTTVDMDNNADWPDRRTHVETLVTGHLADRVRARTGLSGDVTLIEDGIEGGWSEMTVEWGYDFRVRVGGVEAWSTEDQCGSSLPVRPEVPANYTGLGKFMQWLEESNGR